MHHARVSFVNFFQNGLIVQLTPHDQALVQKICKPIELESGQILCGSHEEGDPAVYFLTGATVAMLVEDRQHTSMAVGLLGAEGVVGMSGLLNCLPESLVFQVQTPGPAWRAQSADLRKLMTGHPQIWCFISKYLWHLVEDVAQLSVNIQNHDIRQRLAAWLLLSSDKANTLTLQLTHAHLAHMLGVRRVSITLAAGDLRDGGVLNYARGRMEIVDKSRLESIAHGG